MYKVVLYKTETGYCPFEVFINDLRKDGSKQDLEKIKLYIRLLEDNGEEIIYNSNWAKKLNSVVYELRPRSNRILYFYCTSNNEYVLLHGFKKKTQKTPAEEIEKAIKEASDYERRINNGK